MAGGRAEGLDHALSQVGRWDIRRRYCKATMAFSAGVIVYLLGWGADTRLNETIALGAWGAFGVAFTGYALGVAWQDRSIVQALGSQRQQGYGYDGWGGGYGGPGGYGSGGVADPDKGV